MRNEKLKLHDAFIEVISKQLHYFDRMDRLDPITGTASDLQEILNGAINRYRNDPRFHAQVTSVVSNLMQVMEEVRKEQADANGSQ